MTNKTRKWSLIVGSHFSLSNDTDSDPMTDYSPGIWAIKTQKSAMKFAKEILADGDEIRVTDYDNPAYHKLANMFIKELGINQLLFNEPSTLREIKSIPMGDKPQNLSQLKKYLSVGKKIHIKNFGVGNERDTIVLRTQTNSVVLEKIAGTGIPSWLEFGKATDWSFDNEGATQYYISREGEKPTSRIEYLTS